MNKIENRFKALEEKLLHSDFRNNPELIDNLLSENFEEIGSNGKITSRKEVIHWLASKNIDDRWSLTDFRVRELAFDMILVNYRAIKLGKTSGNVNGSFRSSVWVLREENWRMTFHQATKIL